MTDSEGKGQPPTAAEKRQARLEQELRANLQRRKAQARARRDGPETTKDNGDETSSG